MPQHQPQPQHHTQHHTQGQTGSHAQAQTGNHTHAQAQAGNPARSTVESPHPPIATRERQPGRPGNGARKSGRSALEGSRRESVVSHALLVFASLVALYPFVQILLVALHEPGARVTGFSVPSSLHFDNFVTAWNKGLFSSALVSSLIVAVSVVAITLVVSVLAGYAFAFFPFPLKGPLMGILLIGLVLPYEATVIPLYYQLRDWGLLNTYWALILPQVGLSLALGTFWMRNFFAGVPGSLREAAQIDGATPFQTLRRIMLPLAVPAITTLATLLFLYAWNEFLLALVLVPNNPDVQTAPLALSFFTSDRRNSDPGVTAAAAVLVALPVLIGYIALQRKFISGMLAGAVKE